MSKNNNSKSFGNKFSINYNKENRNILEVHKPYINPDYSANQILEIENRIIYIDNLSEDINKKNIIKVFKNFGKIEKIWLKLIKNNSNLKENNENGGVSCFLLYESKESIEKALSMNEKWLLNNKINVNKANYFEKDFNKTIYIENLPFIIKEDELMNIFKKCGEIENIRIIRDKKSFKCLGFAFITFKDKLSFYNSLKMDKFVYLGRELKISKSSNINESEKINEKKNKKSKKVYKKVKLNEDDIELLDKVKILSNKKETNESFIENMFQHKPKVPQTIINKKIKKLKKKSKNSEEFISKTLKLKTVEERKFNENILEKDKLLEERRKLRKNKAENNKKYFSYKNILKKHN